MFWGTMYTRLHMSIYMGGLHQTLPLLELGRCGPRLLYYYGRGLCSEDNSTLHQRQMDSRGHCINNDLSSIHFKPIYYATRHEPTNKFHVNAAVRHPVCMVLQEVTRQPDRTAVTVGPYSRYSRTVTAVTDESCSRDRL